MLVDMESLPPGGSNFNIDSLRYGCFIFTNKSKNCNVVDAFHCLESDTHDLDWP